jgi:hypothetical protein
MTTEGYRPPTIRSILGGCLLTLLLLTPLIFVSKTVKLVGVPFLFLPQTLGLLPRVERGDIRVINIASATQVVNFPGAGPYLVYSDNFELLELSLGLELAGAAPWMRITDPETGARVPIDFVERGLMPFDPVFIPGRPVFRFVLSRPGAYQIEHLTRDADVTLVPDTTTGREMEMLLAAVLQAAAVALLVGSVLRRRARSRSARIEALLAPGRVSPKELQQRHTRGSGPPPDPTR